MTKQTMWLCAQRRLRSAWASAQSDQSSLSAWTKLGSLATHWAHSEDSDQTGRMPRLIWVFAGRTLILLVLSCRGSFSHTFFHDCKLFHAPLNRIFRPIVVPIRPYASAPVGHIAKKNTHRMENDSLVFRNCLLKIMTRLGKQSSMKPSFSHLIPKWLSIAL